MLSKLNRFGLALKQVTKYSNFSGVICNKKIFHMLFILFTKHLPYSWYQHGRECLIGARSDFHLRNEYSSHEHSNAIFTDKNSRVVAPCEPKPTTQLYLVEPSRRWKPQVLWSWILC